MKWLRASTITLVVGGVLSIAVGTAAAQDTWTKKADMPTARSYLAASVVDGKAYVIGGLSDQTISLPTVEVYDPATDTWTRKADMPTPRVGLSTSVVRGRIYAIGGLPGAGAVGAACSKVEEYDPVANTWVEKADMPTARLGLASGVVDGKIYAIGGHSTEPGGGTIFSTVEVYDPVTDTWTRKADMPTARTGLSAGVVEGKIYAIGGTAGSPWNGLRTVEVYDPATDSWMRKADMPTGRYNFSISVVSGRIYAIGGVPGLSSGLLTVEVYDPTTDIWVKKADMLTGRLGLTTSTIDGRIYAIGGCPYLRPFLPVSSTVEEYDPNPLVVDFNGDGVVDIRDLLRLIESWGQDDPTCDIAPRPFGDGVVDRKDLEVLMSYWGQEVNDPTLIAHWKLDETGGMTAADSAGDNDALVLGNAAWQPNGKVGGALAFDGKDDFVRSGSIVLDPAAGPFSAIAWVKGGAPNRVIVSQFGAADWLYLNQFGMLATDLKAPGRVGKSLTSDAYVLDDQWHRVAVVWDRTNRTLQMDGVEVARDTQPSLPASNGNLFIGAGKNLGANTFWSGLIDDVRIYSRVVAP